MAIKLLTDSTSYIPKELLEKYNIDVVSLDIVFRDITYKEVSLENSFFYKKLAESSSLPTSSQPAISDMTSVFERNAKNGDKTIAIFISSKMSGTFDTANMAKNMVLENFPEAEIEVIDSLSNSMQLGYAVLAAAKAVEKGLSYEECIEAAKSNVKRSKFIFLPDNLEFLRKGGRIGAASALVGNLMRIKPILTVSKGTVHVLNKVRTKKRAVSTLIDIFMNDIKEFGFGEVKVHHIECVDEALELANEVKKRIGQAVDIVSIGPVIGTHVGPGAIGLVYYTKEILNN